MVNEYYTLPIAFKRILDRKELEKCDVQTSIAQKIHLILITFFEESRFNRQFGCLIWEYDFENIYNISAWKDRVNKSLKETLEINEKRLINILVEVDIQKEEISEDQLHAIKELHKRLDVKVTGNLLKTNELFGFSEPIFISPISLD